MIVNNGAMIFLSVFPVPNMNYTWFWIDEPAVSFIKLAVSSG